jgi:hypothetical protein
MTLVWYDLRFPAALEAEDVSVLLRCLVADGRFTPSLFSDTHSLVLETELSAGGVAWRIGGTVLVTDRLRSSAESVLPSLSFTPVDRPRLSDGRAVEVRLVASERLLDIGQAEAASQRLLGLTGELRGRERLVVQWQTGGWMRRTPIAPTRTGKTDRRPGQLLTGTPPRRNSEQAAAARTKQTDHLFATVGRVAVANATGNRAHHLLRSVAGSWQLLQAPGVGLSRRLTPSWLTRRRITRCSSVGFGAPCRMTAAELAAVIGWPLGGPRLPGVAYVSSPVLPLPESVLRPSGAVTDSDRVLGEAGFPAQAGQAAVLGIRSSLRHLHVIGPTGVGKSTVLARLILADIAAGRSVVAIDPKGDLVTDVLERLPAEAADRVAVLDPTDQAPVGINPLTGGPVGIDGVIHVLRSMWGSSWGPRLGDVLLAGMTTLAATPGHSLAELPLLLSEPGFRAPLVARATQRDPLGVGTFWPWFDSLSPDMRAQVLAPVMSRLRALLVRPALRAVLGQTTPRFDLTTVFTERQCLLVRLPKGQLGDDGARLLGSLLVAQLWRLAQGRIAVPARRRHPVSMVLDEFGEFLRLPMDLADVMATARGLGVGLTLAHQHLGQLSGPVRSAVLANASSRLVFGSDIDDASVLAKRSGGVVTANAIAGLEAFEAYASLHTKTGSSTYGSLRTLPLGPVLRSESHMLAANRERFGVAARLTDERLKAHLNSPPPGGSGSLGGRPKGST